MVSFLNNFKKELFVFRRIFLVFCDLILIFISILISIWISNGNSNQPYFSRDLLVLYPILITISLAIYFISSQYKGLTRYIGSKELYKIFLRNIFVAFLSYIFIFSQSFYIPNFKFWILFVFSLTGSTAFLRFSLRDFIIFLNRFNEESKNVVIYGAGSAGAQLLSSIKGFENNEVIAFLDDNKKLQGNNLGGLRIYSPEYIYKIKKLRNIDKILLAMPNITLQRRREIIKFIQPSEIPILQVPSLDKLISGKENIDNLIPVEVEELIGRDVMDKKYNVFSSYLKDTVICVTGAGGSIGSQLCLSILEIKPKLIILFEMCEANLYKIMQEINYLKSDVKIISILGDAKDEKFLKEIFLRYSVDIVFHSAAYKHVPLVEINPIAGISNNVITTFSICKAAEDTCVKKTILISTDKAVRPTNVMGASKRMAEIIIQNFSYQSKTKKSDYKSKKIYSIVRFGNVIGSSGSVVPRFKKQISNGGPITLTHENIIRFFMTIKEAAQLVIQASYLAEGGDIFLLDMGEPVKIRDLAEKMILLSGKSIKNKDNLKGDIEILTTGLRPGEKLYEELLITGKSQKTLHPLIFKALDTSITNNKFLSKFEKFRSMIEERNLEGTLDFLSYFVPEWQPSEESQKFKKNK